MVIIILLIGKNREFRAHLVCPMNQDKVVYNAAEEVAVELYGYIDPDDQYWCSYTGRALETAVACPYQCIVEKDIMEQEKHLKEFTVCSGHGICAADPFAGFVRCLCDDGYNNDFYCRNETLSPTTKPTVAPIEEGGTSEEGSTVEMSKKARDGFVIAIIILVCVVLLLVVIFGICMRRLKLENRILQSKVDDSEFRRFAGDTSAGNTIVGDDGKRGFETIPVTAGGDDDDDDDDASD